MEKYLPRIIGSFVNFLSYFSSKYAAKLAVKVFSTPRKGRLDKEAFDYLQSASIQDLNHDDFSFRTYHWKGSKATVLLVHGWESNAFRWKDLIQLLKKEDYSIIAVDAPAHGASGSKIFNAILYSECIHTVMEAFDIDYVVGHSVGGNSVALALQSYKKQSIKKFVIMGSPSNFAGLVQHYVDLMGYNSKVISAMHDYFLEHFRHTVDHYKASNFLGKIEAEGLIIHDKMDDVIPFKNALENYRAYPNAKLIKTESLGHRLRSYKVYGYILDFLND
ncbi:alpha/beta hydrolase [Hyunsoonleella sp. SJ7]|uniref:Alpha/beta hydrolase n=1 Tax=Hyunsoonleella aquatilis TaxID=2762758 RepID=A0A923HDR2_9FLAO|nr:alpha/beta hydrolase [Hyunsoonleella aquatilis]MBC3759296.1 alpha/beta hydrolase [Hyunsoonleella aquatilis]